MTNAPNGRDDRPPTVAVIQTRVARPAALAVTRRGPVTSAIAKQPATAARLALDLVNLHGDDQADRSVHGGPDKAVYCYPSEHAAAWSEDGFDLPAGSAGENAVLQGATEDEVRIGDIWRWGDAVVQISQPRAPCFKLALHTGRKDIALAMITSGRSGWYLRTIEPGEVDTTGAMELLERDDANATLLATFAVQFPGHRAEADDPATVDAVLRSPALAPEWSGYVRARNPLADPDLP